MADTTYRVQIEYDVHDKTKAKLTVLGSELDRTNHRAQQLKSTLGALGTGALGFAGGMMFGVVLGGLRRLSQGMIQVNETAEDAQITIAGMARAEGVSASMPRAMAFAAEQMNRIRKDAAALPGTAEEYVTIFESAFTGAVEAGINKADVAPFTNKIGAIASAFRIPAEVAGRELDMILRGRAGSHIVLWSRVLQSQVHKTADEWNKMAPEARAHALQQAASHYDDMIGATATSWNAIEGTTKQHLVDLQRAATSPLFEAMKGYLTRFNTWFEKNEPRILSFAKELGTRLAKGLERVVEIAKDLMPMLGGMTPGGLLGSIGSTLTVGAGVSAVGGALGTAGMGVGGGVAAAVALPVVAALSEPSKDLSFSMGQFGIGLTFLKNEFAGLMHELAPLGRAFITLGGWLLDLIGAVTLVVKWIFKIGNLLARVFGGVLFNALLPRGGTYGVDIGEEVNMPASERGVHLPEAARAPETQSRMPAQTQQERDLLAQEAKAQLDLIDRQRKVAHPGRTTFNVKIQQTINDSSNPDRVLIDTRRAIWMAINHPIETPTSVVAR
jgi:hypothetical protein